jgi:hypothetical protein
MKFTAAVFFAMIASSSAFAESSARDDLRSLQTDVRAIQADIPPESKWSATTTPWRVCYRMGMISTKLASISENAKQSTEYFDDKKNFFAENSFRSIEKIFTNIKSFCGMSLAGSEEAVFPADTEKFKREFSLFRASLDSLENGLK